MKDPNTVYNFATTILLQTHCNINLKWGLPAFVPPPPFSYISYFESVTVSFVFAVNTCKMCFLPPHLMIKRLLSKNWRDYVSNGKKILAVWYRNKCLSWCLFISRRRGGAEAPNIGSMRVNTGGKKKRKTTWLRFGDGL